MWSLIARLGNVELLRCMLDHSIDKDSTDDDGYSVLWWVIASGNVEAVQYLLDQQVAVPSYEPEQQEKDKFMYNIHQAYQDPYISAIGCNRLDIVELLQEYGSKSCDFFTFYCIEMCYD